MAWYCFVWMAFFFGFVFSCLFVFDLIFIFYLLLCLRMEHLTDAVQYIGQEQFHTCTCTIIPSLDTAL